MTVSEGPGAETTPRIPDDRQVRIAPHVSTSELHAELVLLNFESETYFGLDAVGARILAALTAAPSVELAVQALLAEFDVDAQRLRADIDRLVDELLAGGLVELRAA